MKKLMALMALATMMVACGELEPTTQVVRVVFEEGEAVEAVAEQAAIELEGGLIVITSERPVMAFSTVQFDGDRIHYDIDHEARKVFVRVYVDGEIGPVDGSDYLFRLKHEGGLGW